MQSLDSYAHLSRVPLEAEGNILGAGVDSLLVGAAGNVGSVKGRGTVVGDNAALDTKGAGRDGATADESIALDTAVTLAGLEGERRARAAGSVGGRATTRVVPLAGADEEALVARAVLEADGDGALAGRSAGGSRASGGGGRRAAARLGEVLDAGGGAGRAGADGIGSDEFSGLDGALDVELVPELVEGAALAVDDDVVAVVRLESGLDGSKRVCLGGGGHNAGLLQPGIRRERLEHADGGVEEVNNLLARLVVAVAGRVEGAHAGGVLAKLVLPEGFVVALVVLPVLLHVAECIGGAGAQDIADVGVLAVLVAVLVKRAIAVIGPTRELSVYWLCRGGDIEMRTRDRGRSKSQKDQWKGWYPRTASGQSDHQGTRSSTCWQ